MTGRKRVLLSWSSGKDSAWTLHVLRARGDVEVVALFTTTHAADARVAIHRVPVELLRLQASAVGLPLWEVPIPSPCPNVEYEAAMATVIERARAERVEQLAFGDLFLEDVRRYREERLRGTGLAPLFPLWGAPTDALARAMIDGGLQARLTCVDPAQLPVSFAGRSFDRALLADLPATVDPCGERGEFHTFAHAGPMFARPVAVDVGAIEARDGFVFAELRAAAAPR